MPEVAPSVAPMLESDLGTVLAVFVRGDGSTGRVMLDLKVELDAESIERGPDGEIDFAYVVFQARYDPNRFPPGQSHVFYGDAAIRDSVNLQLGALGIPASAGFSESGRQARGVLDFDVSFEIIDHLWPELKAEYSPSMAL